MAIRTGLEVLRDSRFNALSGRRAGLVTNPSAVDHQLTSAYTILTNAPEVRVTALFGPEHGFAGGVPDGQHVGASTDPRTGLPVCSLYGDSYRPTPAMLDNVDVLVCDIQDIGVRYYTYTWTISHILEAAGEHNISVMILDRPNPLGGTRIDGPQLDMSKSSFVGRFPVPVQYGMTLGEITQLINATWNPTPADLTVVTCDGWSRDSMWEHTGLPWVPPSPNMPHMSTLRHYPGACLVEGTNCSEGRGTPLPFEIAGAPWIDAYDLADRLNNEAWAAPMGARFRPHSFRPTSSKWSGEDCQGVQVTITDLARWRPIEVWLGTIAMIHSLYPDRFEWNKHHFDRLIGSSWLRGEIDNCDGDAINTVLARLATEWREDCNAFALARQPYLLYE